MRVAFVSQPRDSLKAVGPQSGSVAIVLGKLATALGEEVEAVAVAPLRPGEPDLEIGEGGLAIHRVASGSRELEKLLELLDPRSPPRLMRKAYYRQYFERVAARLLQIRPDVVHVMTAAPAGPVLRRTLPNVTLVLHLHDSMLGTLHPATAATLVEPFDAVVTCSDWLAGMLRRHLPGHAGRIWPVGNGIDVPEIGPEPGRCRPIRKLLMVGRISPEKGPHVLLDAFCRLAPDYPDLTLDLVGPLGLLPLGHARLLAKGQPAMGAAIREFYGSGLNALWAQFHQPAAALMRHLIASVPTELRGHIHFTGPQPHDRLAAIYQAADILVQPSVCTEGFGLPVAEAMASGRPVVAAKLGGLLDLVEPGVTGLLVEPGNAGALADALRLLIDNPERAQALGRAGRRRAVEKFTWKAASKRLALVYRELQER